MIEVRQTRDFAAWRAGLRDSVMRKRIGARIDRLAFGHPGNVKQVGDGVSELRLHFGPGYRLYFVGRGEVLIVLLCGRRQIDTGAGHRQGETPRAGT